VRQQLTQTSIIQAKLAKRFKSLITDRITSISEIAQINTATDSFSH